MSRPKKQTARHSRRVAKALHARVRVTFEPENKRTAMRAAETVATYGRSKKVGVNSVK